MALQTSSWEKMRRMQEGSSSAARCASGWGSGYFDRRCDWVVSLHSANESVEAVSLTAPVKSPSSSFEDTRADKCSKCAESDDGLETAQWGHCETLAGIEAGDGVLSDSN
jgi:hypothetical protein